MLCGRLNWYKKGIQRVRPPFDKRKGKLKGVVNDMIGTFGALWGLAGIVFLLGSAIYRLAPMAVEVFSYDFLWYHWVSLVVNVLFMAYAEGFRGFQQKFSPRVAARAKYLKGNPETLYILLGPLFCMGYIYATKRRKVTSISLTAGIIILILLVRILPQPWRGVVDVGVIIGLVWGIFSLLFFSIQAFTSEKFHYSPEISEEENVSI